MLRGKLGKTISGLTLAVGLLAGSAVPALAYDHNRDYREQEKCEKRIRKAEDRLQREIYKHGRFSRQAEQRRRELWEARQQCRWDFDRDRYRDRDRDHDRDRDRDRW